MSVFSKGKKSWVEFPFYDKRRRVRLAWGTCFTAAATEAAGAATVVGGSFPGPCSRQAAAAPSKSVSAGASSLPVDG